MADFAAWKHETLVTFAQDIQQDRRKILEAMAGLLADYEAKGAIFCFTPARNEAYRAARRILDGAR
jgi:hypothetical protein